ncbi:MAG: hypothetical protein IT558_00995 [Alphaproteobacteria bacterium]|nr:hypothetical protein [Alphaproteobacteria bacterium]
MAALPGVAIAEVYVSKDKNRAQAEKSQEPPKTYIPQKKTNSWSLKSWLGLEKRQERSGEAPATQVYLRKGGKGVGWKIVSSAARTPEELMRKIAIDNATQSSVLKAQNEMFEKRMALYEKERLEREKKYLAAALIQEKLDAQLLEKKHRALAVAVALNEDLQDKADKETRKYKEDKNYTTVPTKKLIYNKPKKLDKPSRVFKNYR